MCAEGAQCGPFSPDIYDDQLARLRSSLGAFPLLLEVKLDIEASSARGDSMKAAAGTAGGCSRLRGTGSTNVAAGMEYEAVDESDSEEVASGDEAPDAGLR